MPRLAVEAELARGEPLLPLGLLGLLRCLDCQGRLEQRGPADRSAYPDLGLNGCLGCRDCDERYPVIAGTVRMLPRGMRARLWDQYPQAAETLRAAGIPRPGAADRGARGVRQRTADSFAYEWEQFGALRAQWRQNFLDYMQPHSPESFAGRLVLDVGTGSGRHAFHAAELGARVVAVDLGRSIDVARSNLPSTALTVQADAEQLPFAPETFDFVMSIGVLHHLPDPRRALARLVPLARTGGHVHIYLYWVPERAWQVHVLGLVSRVRVVTVRLPHRLLHALCVPLAAGLALACVWPYGALRGRPRTRRIAHAFPLKTYADYPFGVLVNDQFDRFSAPLERRYARTEVLQLLDGLGLSDIRVLPHHGWVADGRAGGATCAS